MRGIKAGACALCGMLVASAGAQERPSDQATPVFRTTTDVVMLDAVVRDRRGQIVRDLKPGEIEVYEDGILQRVAAFRFFEGGVLVDTSAESAVTPGPAAPPATPAARAPGVQTLRHPNLVTLVFDQLGADGRPLARKAALDFINLQDRPDVYVSVFQIGQTLRIVQQFTTDRERLREAVKLVTGEVNTQYSAATDDLAGAVRSAEEARKRLDAATSSPVAGPEGAATLATLGQEAAMADMVVNTLRMTQSLQREQQGMSSLHALLALAKKQQILSGRKTILFFSEGLQAPPNLEHVLKSTISEANRANVSVYAVDARGLRTASDMREAADSLRSAVATSQRQNMSSGGRAVTREEVMIADTAESAIRLNTQATLGELAESTGGVLIANSNDLRKGISRAVGDLSGYYEVSYTPANRNFDGRFRKIAIKVNRPGVTVQARAGYFALPPGEAAVDFPFELDLVMALREPKPPTELPLHVRAFRFGYEGTRRRFTLVAELPLERIQTVESGGLEQAHFSFLALVRDAAGAVAEKFSEDTPVLVPKEKLPALKQGGAVFIRSFALGQGEYELQTAVRDHQSNQRGVERLPLAVPAARGLTISTPAFVKRTEATTPGALDSPDPFRAGEVRLVPYVLDPEVVSGDLPLFLMVYPAPGEPPRQVLLEFSRDGKVTGRSTPALPAPDKQGYISFLAPIPVSRFTPGRYDLRIVVQQGAETAEERLTFAVVPAASQPR
jgi:VWFA-related protein